MKNSSPIGAGHLSLNKLVLILISNQHLYSDSSLSLNCAAKIVRNAILAKKVFNFSNLAVEIFQIFVNIFGGIWYAVQLNVLKTVAYVWPLFAVTVSIVARFYVVAENK